MASIAIPKPGTEHGPCVDTKCGHADCEINRHAAKGTCELCGKRIGFDTDFMIAEEGDGAVHSLCLYQEVNQGLTFE